MVMIKDPATKRLISVQTYDKDFIVSNAQAQKHKSQNLIAADLLTKNNWNFNEWNTKEDVYSDIALNNLSGMKMPSDKNKYAGGLLSHNW